MAGVIGKIKKISGTKYPGHVSLVLTDFTDSHRKFIDP
jgi:hypothetical protein